MNAYKLFRLRKDGTLGSLFVDRGAVLPIGEWMIAQDIPTSGLAHRPGWHCCAEMVAPHLKPVLSNGEIRVWRKVEISEYEAWPRPEHQGKTWYIANLMKILEET